MLDKNIKCLYGKTLKYSLHDNRYNSEALRGWYDGQKELSLKGISILSEMIGSETAAGVDFGFSSNGFFWVKSHQHVLHLPSPFGGFTLHETQVISALSFLLEKGGEEAGINLASFLKCLPLKVESEPKSYGFNTLSSYDFDQIKDPKIDTEVIAKNKKRLDLYIEWLNKDDELCAIVIEAKIGHKITKGQLSCYGQHLKEKRERPAKANFYIIAKDGDALKEKKKFDKHNYWKTVRWGKILRNWEYCLSKSYSLKCENACSESISVTQNNLLRRVIWQATTSCEVN